MLELCLNNNGEAVFTEREHFQRYASQTLSSVVGTMTNIQPSISRSDAGQMGRAGQGARTYGFAPFIGRPAPVVGGVPRQGQPLLVGQGSISIVAEIPFQAQQQRGDAPANSQGMHEPPMD